MPTGPRHHRLSIEEVDGRQIVREAYCRCTIGSDHNDSDEDILDNDDGNDDEALSVYDAADIWLSNGMDEDYMFNYSEDELRRIADLS